MIERGKTVFKHTAAENTLAISCNCIGPQNGEPLCPCRMRNVKIVGGRYIETHDLGPAPASADKEQEHE